MPHTRYLVWTAYSNVRVTYKRGLISIRYMLGTFDDNFKKAIYKYMYIKMGFIYY